MFRVLLWDGFDNIKMSVSRSFVVVEERLLRLLVRPLMCMNVTVKAPLPRRAARISAFRISNQNRRIWCLSVGRDERRRDYALIRLQVRCETFVAHK